MDTDYILCECSLESLRDFVASIEEQFDVKVVKQPAICMTMIQAEDSVELQPFYLGEALTTVCQLTVNDEIGYGICLGDEPMRAYCMAFVDAAIRLKDIDLTPLRSFLQEQSVLIEQARTLEHNQILRTKVDFKIMEQD